MPITVFPCAIVPRLIVTDSRMITLFPMTVMVFSPEYFRSWGASPIEQL
ncbi:uncharacterized protein METZ01_LOCUS34479 [marine metagenome]|uniref:Uncharacterized protein n=1 Tax=marine metagenome TaxID=408172 RepID=A0A381QQI9_9ZZZZ